MKWEAKGARAEARRRVSAGEQQIHSLLEMVPMAATALLAAMHWDQAMALVGRGAGGGGRRADFRLRAKINPLSGRSKAAVIAGVLLFGAVPYIEEFVRCARGPRARAARV